MKTREELAEKWLRDNDWDYQKYGDRRGDRSAYDGLMNYEISDELTTAFIAGFDAGFARAVEMAWKICAGPDEGYLHGCDCRTRVKLLEKVPDETFAEEKK